MAVSTLAAAKRLCEKSGWSLSNLKLQKILYIAHMFHLGEMGEPLIAGEFQAWDYGPVEPNLYRKAKIFGSSPVKNIFSSAAALPVCSEAEFLDQAAEKLGSKSPGQLVAITHWKDGAWAKNYIPGAIGVTIPDDDILAEYRARSREAAR